ncbi:MAG: malto-oligosyltrehalose trehalohydrolase [Planctomycetes bacterium]|nr:malto-oligosyltrehalose trehalohydrolase [Planctomycetota bacterium]
MHTFAVWSPKAEQVSVVTDEGEFSMQREDRGWWRVAVASAGPGTRYAFRVDGGSERPDPRSPFQPDGPHARSRVVDHSEFRWTDAGFQAKPLSSAVIYELHIGTFTEAGTFHAAIERLDHLVDLGVTHVELMPVAEFDGDRGWGYDGVDLFAPHHHYGDPGSLKSLVNACHERGLAVLLDVVYNHLGPSGNYLREFGPYFSDRHHTPWGEAVNFDGPYSDGVRRFFCDNALMWLRDYHFDGLRLDAVHAIVDTSAIPFLEQLALEVEQLQAHLGRHLVLIAESDLNDPRLVRSRESGGMELDAQWSDDFHHALHTVLSGETSGYYADFGAVSDLAKAFQQPFLYAGEASQFRRRRHGRPPTELPAHRFLAYMHNHDQIGNRAAGDRLASGIDADLAMVGAALVLLSPYVPMLFQGEEWRASSPFQYFVNFGDAELNRAVREGRRREFGEFGWRPEQIADPTDEATFQRSKLKWSELDGAEHSQMVAWYKQLIELRRRIPALTDGRLELIESECDDERRWLLVERGPIAILANLSEQPLELPMKPEWPTHVLLASKPDIRIDAAARLPANSIAVLGPEE